MSCGSSRTTSLKEFKQNFYTTTEGDTLYTKINRLGDHFKDGGKFRIVVTKDGKILNSSRKLLK